MASTLYLRHRRWGVRVLDDDDDGVRLRASYAGGEAATLELTMRHLAVRQRQPDLRLASTADTFIEVRAAGVTEDVVAAGCELLKQMLEGRIETVAVRPGRRPRRAGCPSARRPSERA